MKIGIAGVGIGPSATGAMVRAAAVTAERVGFATCWFGEHAVQFANEAEELYPDRHDPKRKSINLMADPATALPDAVVAMTWAAAATQRIEIGSNIIILPQRHPVVLAKALASLDDFSGGRVTLGAGSGWAVREYEATGGADWSSRGKRMDEYTAALRALWADCPASFSGETVTFRDAYLVPRPAHAIQILFGGESTAVQKRVARCGDGWMPARLDLEAAPSIIRNLRECTTEAGRDPDALRIIKSITIWDALDDLPRDRDASVTEFKLACFGEVPEEESEMVGKIEEWGEKLVDYVARL